jgi:hypothetical protein
MYHGATYEKHDRRFGLLYFFDEGAPRLESEVLVGGIWSTRDKHRKGRGVGVCFHARG